MDLFAYQAQSPIVKANALQGPIHPTLGIAMDMSIQLQAANGAICTLSLGFNNEGPLGTFFRYIGDTGTYIARYDDLVNGKDEKIDVSQVDVSMNGIELQDREFIAAIREGRRPQWQRGASAAPATKSFISWAATEMTHPEAASPLPLKGRSQAKPVPAAAGSKRCATSISTPGDRIEMKTRRPFGSKLWAWVHEPQPRYGVPPTRARRRRIAAPRASMRHRLLRHPPRSTALAPAETLVGEVLAPAPPSLRAGQQVAACRAWAASASSTAGPPRSRPPARTRCAACAPGHRPLLPAPLGQTEPIEDSVGAHSL